MKIFRDNHAILKGIFLIVTIITCLTLSFSCNILSAGSYPYAETYVIHADENEVIRAVNSFKSKYPETVVPLRNLPDGRSDSIDYWYHVYFYISKENKIVHCWTRPKSESETIFAFIGINQGLKLGKWKDLNKDFGWSENQRVLKGLENSFLNPIKQIAQEENGL